MPVALIVRHKCWGCGLRWHNLDNRARPARHSSVSDERYRCPKVVGATIRVDICGQAVPSRWVRRCVCAGFRRLANSQPSFRPCWLAPILRVFAGLVPIVGRRKSPRPSSRSPSWGSYPPIGRAYLRAERYSFAVEC